MRSAPACWWGIEKFLSDPAERAKVLLSLAVVAPEGLFLVVAPYDRPRLRREDQSDAGLGCAG